jgi:hypothetical protein
MRDYQFSENEAGAEIPECVNSSFLLHILRLYRVATEASQWLSVQYPDPHVQIGCNTHPDYIRYEKPACNGRHTKEHDNVN